MNVNAIMSKSQRGNKIQQSTLGFESKLEKNYRTEEKAIGHKKKE